MTPFPFQVCQSQTTLGDVDVQLQPVVCCACVEILVVVSTIPSPSLSQLKKYQTASRGLPHTHLDSLLPLRLLSYLLEFSL